ncbi:hypothetical protein XBJ1_1639 [Xenorhabdus bovienii SS-2004]|uniref:Uncharacterized protein n=2 Tax=Xenorhabdus bovienii TaxID=40576 RepID=D3V3H2_XENBS|nr:hypothetical protein XBJ1_1639 [Xenorhabdus bovienii SS-2004]
MLGQLQNVVMPEKLADYNTHQEPGRSYLKTENPCDQKRPETILKIQTQHYSDADSMSRELQTEAGNIR